ncbi:MAG: aldehyde dehydrogenase family protein [Verrucomicrobia bacterium]|nr:aldehyde dehydrogenase family protein [Verrucomicrobiota bacterium]
MSKIDVTPLGTGHDGIVDRAKHENASWIIAGEVISTGRATSHIGSPNRNQAATYTGVENGLLALAVSAARQAFWAWDALGFDRRKTILARLPDIFDEHADEWSILLSAELRISLSEAKWEAKLLINAFRLTLTQMEIGHKETNAQAPQHITKCYVPIDHAGRRGTRNLPILMTFGKVLPALLAGETMVLRPPLSVPLTVLRISECISALLPAGVFNLAARDRDRRPKLALQTGIELITFSSSANIAALGLAQPTPAGKLESSTSGLVPDAGGNPLLGRIALLPIIREAGRHGLASMLFNILSFQPTRIISQVLVWSLTRRASYTCPLLT